MIFYNSVSKIYSVHRNPVPVLNNVTFRIPHGEVVVFLGPSGCGKSTMLRMTNRLENVTQGHILVNNQDIQTIDPITLRLKMGYVIQEVGLFPNKTVSQNIAIAPRLLKWKTRKINHRVDELLELVNLDPRLYRDRYPIQLSGGQQQRVGIARALAADPEILLMDEPFGAIDPINRDQIQDEFLKLQSKLKKTVIFVSHDIHEAIKMADKIAIFNEGQLVQYDTPENILTQPANDFVADFIGADAALKILSLLRAKDIVKRNEKLLLSGTTQAKDALAHIEMHQLRYAIVLVDNKLHGFVNPKTLKYESGQISNLAKKFKVVVDGRDTLRDVLSELLANDSTVACVTDQDNNFLGTVTYNNIHANIVDKFEGDDAD